MDRTARDACIRRLRPAHIVRIYSVTSFKGTLFAFARPPLNLHVLEVPVTFAAYLFEFNNWPTFF